MMEKKRSFDESERYILAIRKEEGIQVEVNCNGADLLFFVYELLKTIRDQATKQREWMFLHAMKNTVDMLFGSKAEEK